MRKAGLLLAATGVCVAGASALADSVSVSAMTGTVQQTTALTGFATTGAMMDGMSVTAFFSGGGSETIFWADTGAVSGGATGTGWSIAESGDTFGGTWTLVSSSASINKIVIDAGVGNSVFDRTFGGANGTAGSARGLDFAVTSGLSGLDIAAMYFNAVGVGGAAPVGDLYRHLEIDFATLGAAFANRTLTFEQDTDNLLFAGDIRPIPLPTSAGLAAVGFGLVAVRRRR